MAMARRTPDIDYVLTRAVAEIIVRDELVQLLRKAGSCASKRGSTPLLRTSTSGTW